MHFQRLKDLHRKTRGHSVPELSLRIPQALNWLHKTELSEDDLDTQSIRVPLDNQFIYQHFCDYHSGKLSEEEWKASFIASKKRDSAALANQDTTQVLSIVFRRIYMLRNQIMHGGSTWQGKVNRSQLKGSVALLNKIVPVMLELMLHHNENEWGELFYPVTGVE